MNFKIVIGVVDGVREYLNMFYPANFDIQCPDCHKRTVRLLSSGDSYMSKSFWTCESCDRFFSTVNDEK